MCSIGFQSQYNNQVFTQMFKPLMDYPGLIRKYVNFHIQGGHRVTSVIYYIQ